MNRRRHRDVPTIPMPGTEVPRLSGSELRKTKTYRRPMGWAACPRCSSGRVAVLPDAGHLVYREHTYATYSGAAMPCQASHQRVCVLPPRSAPDPGWTVVYGCPCEGKR